MVSEEELKDMSPEEIQELQKKNCIFCHIISGKVPGKKVYEDDLIIGIFDINPASAGHILLIPKKHIVIMPQMSDEEIGHIFTVAKKLSLALIKNLKAKGTNIFVANGAIAGQKAPHMMVHIIPRNDGDGINLKPPEIEISPDKLEQIRQKLLPKIKETFKLSDGQMTQLGMTAPVQPTNVQEPEQDRQSDALENEQDKESDPLQEEELDFDALDKVLKNGM